VKLPETLPEILGVNECHGDITPSRPNGLSCAPIPALVRFAAMTISTVKSPRIIVASAWLVHAVAWFLPVAKLGGAHSDLFGPIRGWIAFRAALSPVWPYESVHSDAWYYSVLSVASAATTVLFIVGSPLVLWCESRRVQRACAWFAAGAFIVNSHWYVLFGADRNQLSVGYFLWWLSFALLAIGLFRLSTENKGI